MAKERSFGISRRLLGRLLLITAALLALGAIPLAFDRTIPCQASPESTLLVGLHPALIDYRQEVAAYLDAPLALDAVWVWPTGLEDPDDLFLVGCPRGFDWSVWFGSARDGALSVVVNSTSPSGRGTTRRSVHGRGRPEDPSDALQELSGAVLVEIFGSEKAWPGLDYFKGADPEAVRNLVHGEALFRKSNFERAAEVFGYVVEDEPTSAWGWYRLAVAKAWDRGQIPAWGAMAQAMALLDSLQPADRALVQAVDEHYQLEYGFREAFEAVENESAEANLQHGDALFHLARMRGGNPQEAIPYFEEAVRLDPGLTPARLHLIDAAILAGDSAAASRHLAAFSRRARGSIPWLRARYAVDLVFGDPRTLRRAVAAIDSAKARLPFSVPYLAQEYLGAPGLLPLQERLLVTDARLAAGVADPEDRETRGARRLLVYNYLYRGRLDDAAQVLALLGVEDRAFRRLIPFSAELWGLSWPGPPVTEAVDPEDPVDVFYAAAGRIERGEIAAYRALKGTIDRLAAEDPDVVLWRRALEARRLWLDGEDRAIEDLRAVVTHSDVLTYFGTHETMRWWLAGMAWEQGAWSEAVKWYGSLPDNPWARCRATLAQRRDQGEEVPRPEEVCGTLAVAPGGRPTVGRPTRTNGAQ